MHGELFITFISQSPEDEERIKKLNEEIEMHFQKYWKKETVEESTEISID
ncbi:hypothetical protein [Methanimicrococcus blatticola]|uniref:Uncharacterized protein n=1 Tax=Methanimicrococcus blatticola TaxID=91560 RepID=A0A484F3Z4_9EURY|nr:hypothetical protein [Methanimicrococcus blatticola]MBZ3936066.1 hypothetical protein [Methanimicrococcus blatticola]MCC2509323.1 hypothetical protein [Methanimicrococcus blatticola]TDQ68208.1 hypothetical protein C7391_1146 [Methanimicrococcus blatticola]